MGRKEERSAKRKEKLADLKSERESRGDEVDPDWFVDAQEAAASGDLDVVKKDRGVGGGKRAAGGDDAAEGGADKKEVDTSLDQFMSDADAAMSHPKQASAFRRGDLILVEQDVCKVSEMSTSKTGKHGAAKVLFKAVSILSGKNAQFSASSTSSCQAPVTKVTEYSILGIENGILTLLTAEGAIHEGVKLPSDEELTAQIRQRFEAGEEFTISVLAVMGYELVTSYKKI